MLIETIVGPRARQSKNPALIGGFLVREAYASKAVAGPPDGESDAKEQRVNPLPLANV